MDNQVKYTQVAAKAVSLAELFDARFEQGLDGPVKFRVELAAPEGPSTGGGKQALQHIKLIPAISGPAIVIGSANTIRQAAEIRTFDHIAALYAQRFKGASIPVDPARYRALAESLAQFFRAMKLTVTFAEPEPGLAPAPAPASGLPAWLPAAVGFTAGMLVMAAAYWLLFHK